MNQAAFAVRHAATRKTVTKWKQRGWIVFDSDGSVDVRASDSNIKRYRRGCTLRSRQNVDDDVRLALAEARFGNARALAARGALQFAEKSGTLIPLTQAEHVLFEHGRAMRDHWLNWPARVAPVFAAELDIEPAGALRVLTKLVHQHVSELGEPQG